MLHLFLLAHRQGLLQTRLCPKVKGQFQPGKGGYYGYRSRSAPTFSGSQPPKEWTFQGGIKGLLWSVLNLPLWLSDL